MLKKLATDIQNHVKIGFSNPFLVCVDCGAKVPYWHDPARCGSRCEEDSFNYPCGHYANIQCICPTWDPVMGCICKDQTAHKC